MQVSRQELKEWDDHVYALYMQKYYDEWFTPSRKDFEDWLKKYRKRKEQLLSMQTSFVMNVAQ